MYLKQHIVFQELQFYDIVDICSMLNFKILIYVKLPISLEIDTPNKQKISLNGDCNLITN